MSKSKDLERRARAYAERFMSIVIKNPYGVLMAEELRRKYDERARRIAAAADDDDEDERGAEACIIATALALLVAEAIERTNRDRQDRLERN